MDVIIILTLACSTMIFYDNVAGEENMQSESITSSTFLEYEEKNHERIVEEMKSSNIKENLRYLSEYPHHPGSKRNRELAEHIADRWRNSGFDKTEIYPYNILMSYPKYPGEIWIRKNGVVKKKLIIENEPPFDDSEKKGKPLYPFNSYSPKGNVTAEYVYGNYGRDKDFKKLEELGINIKGKIMIFRYGKGYRGYKVQRAERRGAVGVIIYSDPEDHTYSGMEYPDGWMLNRYGVQRGTINRLTGDALSLGYPSKPNYFRINATKYSGNPKIPSQPISFSTAYEILKHMNDDSISLPADFQGGLNFTYRLLSGTNRTITLQVSTEHETKESLTVCTKLFGREQPDRYVMLGNHRDSWTYGAGDASSGTAAMMEIVRSYGKIAKETGWRPRRSIMACSWGAEELGIMDSTEWADDNHRFISQHVTAYLNTDIAVEGNFTVRLKSLRHIEDGIYKAAKSIKAPDNSDKSLYDDWLDKSIILKEDDSISDPFFITPSSGSDYKAFWHTYGTTIADFRYIFSKKDYPIHSIFGHYHTRYESFGWMVKHIDPNFIYHLTIGKLWAGHSLLIADSAIIPFNLEVYTEQIGEHLDQFEEAYKSMLDERGISLSFARERLNELKNKTKSFHDYVKRLDDKRISDYQLRSINDKIMNFERNFLITGMSKKHSARHVIYSTVPNKLKITKFPGIAEAIFFAEKGYKEDWDDVKKQITLLIWCFDTANRSLDFDEWAHINTLSI